MISVDITQGLFPEDDESTLAADNVTPKTVAEHQQHTANAAPVITLDEVPPPKTAAEVIANADDGKCHAHRMQQRTFLSCTKKRGHDGHHKDGKRGWRASSGDALDLRALEVDHGEEGSEATG